MTQYAPIFAYKVREDRSRICLMAIGYKTIPFLTSKRQTPHRVDSFQDCTLGSRLHTITTTEYATGIHPPAPRSKQTDRRVHKHTHTHTHNTYKNTRTQACTRAPAEIVQNIGMSQTFVLWRSNPPVLGHCRRYSRYPR